MSVIINVFKSLFSPGAGQQEEDLKAKVEQVIVRLELMMDKIGELRYKFESRFSNLWRKIIELLKKGDEERARVYAGEAAQLRSMIRIVKAVENMVIMTVERLKTVRDMRELVENLMSLGAAISEVKEQAKAVSPSLAYMLNELNDSVKALIVQTSMESITPIDPIAISNKTLEILNEAMKQAANEVKKKFPEPPVEPIVRVAEGDMATVNAKPKVRQPRREQGKSIEDLLLEYIKEHGGFLDVKDFMERYGYTREEVFEALRRMAEKGLITLV